MGSNDGADRPDTCDDPLVPAGVIEGIDDIVAGRTADKDDLEAALNR